MRTKPKPKAEPRFKKGPVAAEAQQQIERDFLAGFTEASLSEKYQRSPKVISKILQALAMRPVPVERRTKVALEFNLRPAVINTPNGCAFEIKVPTGMDATNNTILLEQLSRFLDQHRGTTEDKDKIKEGV